MLTTLDAPDRTLTLTRWLAAPVPRVWAAWTDPDQLPRWWGPRGFTCQTHEIDLREGGLWRFDMIAPDGTVYPNRHRYRTVVSQARIDYRLDEDGAGNVAFDASARFEAADGGTRLSLSMVFDSPATRVAMENTGAVAHGYTTLDCLAEALDAPRVLSITRILHAPLDRVWRAWTSPEDLARWFQPNDVDIVSSDFAPAEGRAWRTVMRGRDSGTPFPVRGIFEAVEPPRRLVFTHGWEDEAGQVPVTTRITVTLDPMGDRTRLTCLQQGLASETSREGHRNGWTQTLDNLDSHLGAAP